MANVEIDDLDPKATPELTDQFELQETAGGGSFKSTFQGLANLFSTIFAAVLGADDNYVTNAEKTVIGNTSGTNSGDQSAGDFNHDDTANITGTAGQYNHPDNADMTVLGNTSGTNSGDETTTTLGATINGADAKTTPVDADQIGLVDSAAGNILKKLSWANIKATLATYFDTIYLKLVGGVMAGAVDFAYFAAIRFVCPRGTAANLPATGNETQGQLFYATDIETFFVYGASAWKAVISFGPVDLFVNETSGSDAVGKGYASGTGATATVAYAIGLLPPTNGGNVRIFVTGETYSEDISFGGKGFSGSYTISIIGTKTTSALTIASAVKGTGTTTHGSIVETSAGWTVDEHMGKIVQFDDATDTVALQGLYFTVWSNTTDTVTIIGSFDALPTSSDTVTFTSPLTVFDGTFTVKEGQIGLVIEDVDLVTGTAAEAINGESGSSITLLRCWSEYNLYTTGSKAVIQNGYHRSVTGTGGRLLFVQGGSVSTPRTLLDFTDSTPTAGRKCADVSAGGTFNNGNTTCVIQNSVYGIFASGNCIVTMWKGSTTAHNDINNCINTGIYAEAGTQGSFIAAYITYTTNGTDSAADAATFATLI